MFSKFLKKNKNYLDSKSKRDLLHNVYILYIVFIIAIADIFLILQVKDFYSAFVFASVGILTSFFSKNMVVILCLCVIVTHIFKHGSKWKEGFESSPNGDELQEYQEQTQSPDVQNESTDSEQQPDHFESNNLIDSHSSYESTEDSQYMDTDKNSNNKKNDNKKNDNKKNDNKKNDNKKNDNKKNDNKQDDNKQDDNKQDDNKNIKDKIKQMKNIENTTNPDNITKLLERQSLLLDKMQEYKPLLNSIQNISKNLGLSTTSPPK